MLSLVEGHGASVQAVEGWLVYLAGGHLSPSTLRVRRCMMGVFADTYDPLTATPAQLDFFLATRPGGAWSRQGYLSTLRSFYRWLHLSGGRADDPTALLHSIRTPPAIPRPCPEAVYDRALAASEGLTLLALLLGGHAGLRRAEIAGLHSDDVQGGTLVVTGKGRVVRRVPIHPRLAAELTFTGWAFPSVRKLGEHLHPEVPANWIATALGEPWTAHNLRHLAATRWYAGTRDIRAVQALLGHSSTAVTSHYCGIDDSAMVRAVLSVA